MEVAPFRALTQYCAAAIFNVLVSRNGGRPFQGIDTVFPLVFLSFLALVEMKVAPFRA